MNTLVISTFNRISRSLTFTCFLKTSSFSSFVSITSAHVCKRHSLEYLVALHWNRFVNPSWLWINKKGSLILGSVVRNMFREVGCKPKSMLKNKFSFTLVFGTMPRWSFSSTREAAASERYPWLGTKQPLPKQQGQQTLWIYLVHFGFSWL